METEADHTDTQAAVSEDSGPYVVSPYVLGELDYMLARWWGGDAAQRALDELASSDWTLAQFDAADLRVANSIIKRYNGQQIGLADASLVVLAERHETDRILTLDHRHFDVLRTRTGKPFTLLPE